MNQLVLAPAPAAVAVGVDDEIIVVDDVRGVLHLLNPMGALVWRCFDGVSSLDEICADLAEILGAPLATVEVDVGLLAHRLLDEGVAVAPGYVRPMRPEELLEECDCGHGHGHDHDHTHDHDARDGYELAPNP